NIRGGVSINKAIDLLSHTKEAPIKNATEIRKAWNSHRKSVHLGLGFALAYVILKKTEVIQNHNKSIGRNYLTDFLSPMFVGIALVFAKWTQDWLLSFKLSRHSSVKRLVKPQQLWLVPKNIKSKRSLDDIIKSLPSLTEKEKAFLKI